MTQNQTFSKPASAEQPRDEGLSSSVLLCLCCRVPTAECTNLRPPKCRCGEQPVTRHVEGLKQRWQIWCIECGHVRRGITPRKARLNWIRHNTDYQTKV